MLRWPRILPTVAGFRVLQLLPGIGPGTAAARSLDRMLEARDAAAMPSPKSRCRRAQRRTGRTLPRCWRDANRAVPLACRIRAGTALVRAASRTHVRRWPRCARPTSRSSSRSRRAIASRERFPDRADARSARCHQRSRPARRCSTRTTSILSTIHSAKGQEWNVGVRAQCRRRLHPSDLATGTAEEIEEERRLLYVAMTRAKDELCI